jgi:Apea-like HEPN
MNRPEVLAALKAALNPESELYKEVSRKHRDLAPDQADQARSKDLAVPVAAVLANQPECHRYPNMMLRNGSGGRIGFHPIRAAQLLILSAMRNNADSAVNWLADLLENARASGLHVMPLWQLTIEAPVTLTKDVGLLPFSMLSSRFATVWLETPPYPGFGHWMFPWGPSLGTEQPTAALTACKVVDPLFVDADEQIRQDPDPLPYLLEDVRLCLSAISPHPVLGRVRWFQFDDPDLDAAAGTVMGGTAVEILPGPVSPVTLDATAARSLVPKFLALPGNTRDRVRIALQRLDQSMLRREPGDKAADLSIALEALLTDQAGEHTWKVSTRAAMLTGWDLQSKLDRRNVIVATYRMRSSLVHSGSASNMIQVSGRDRMPAANVCEEATRICAAVVRAIVERGGIPSWPEFDVSGGALGWPKTAPPSVGKES